MLTHSLRIAEIFGIEIRINIGWAVIAALIAWSLAQGVFPNLYSGLAISTYWIMATITVFGLAASIVMHELAHSVVAARFGCPVSRITLFMFGGVAALDQEPDSPIGEFLIALAGPAMSLMLASGFYVIGVIVAEASVFANTVHYLALLNLVLAIFNLLPAFPMDGGRALRALLWKVIKNKDRATQVASKTGSIFGALFMGLGVLGVLTGNFVGGLWWILIGGFIRAAAIGEYERLRIATALKGKTVSQFMTSRVDTVPFDLSLRNFIDDHLYIYGHDVFPVLEGDRAIGTIGLTNLKPVKQDEWSTRLVRDTMTPISPGAVTAPHTLAIEALTQMSNARATRLLVIDHGRLVGVLVLKDLLGHIAVRLALDPDTPLKTQSV